MRRAPFNPLLAALPPVIHVGNAQAGRSAFVQFAMAEAQQPRPGGEVVLGHLSELMFVDVVRRYLETLPADRTGWLAAARAVRRARAHGASPHPAHGWTLEGLAREVGFRDRHWPNDSRSSSATHRCVPDQLADAARREPTARWHLDNDRDDRRSSWLRVGGGVQPRVQESGRCAAQRMADQTGSTH